MSTLPVPIATPDDLTYRLGWEVLAAEAAQVTVRIRRIPDPGDSDGIPVVVDSEVSLRGMIGTDQITGQLASKLSPAGRVQVLMMLVDLAYRDGHGDLAEYPIMVPDGGVRMLVLKFRAFSKWLTGLAEHDYEEMSVFMQRHGMAASLRASGIAFLRELVALAPTLRQFDDTPHLLLRWDV